MWFKNITPYRLTRDIDLNPETLEKLLSEFAFTPCASQDFQKFGWSTALGKHGNMFTHVVDGNIFMAACKEEKIIPSQVIAEEMAKRVEALESSEGRPLKKKEKDAIKDDLIIDLLPRAFSRKTFTRLVILPKLKMILVDASASKKAEDALALLRKSLGSLPVVPLCVKSPLELAMTEWVKSGHAPKGFSIGGNAELRSLLEQGGKVRCNNLDLSSDEVMSHINAEKLVTKLSLDWQERMTFILHEDLTFKQVKFDDELRDQNADIDREDVAQRLDADLALMAGELSALFTDIIESLGGLETGDGTAPSRTNEGKDEYYDQAVAWVKEERRASVSGIQRKFKLGYNRAARIIDMMEAENIVSPLTHNGLREVLIAA